MRWRRGALLAAALLLGATRAGAAQQPAPVAPAAPEAGSELVVEVITMGQGEEVWERFGHNSIRVHDLRSGVDVAYNWGMFDFNQPNFLGRFLSGNTKYWMEGFPTDALLAYYRTLNRTIIIQRLALTPAQKLAMRDFVRWNSREENKWYRYDYFGDNCSTRLRDAIDRTLGGALHAAWGGDTTAHTYRSEALRLVDGMPFTQQGMDIALGRPADQRMTAWEEAYVPMRLRDRLRTVRVAGANGAMVPLVESEAVWFQSSREAEASAPPEHSRRNLLIGTIIGLLFAVTGRFATRARGSRLALGTAGAAWAFVTGLLGVILLLAWAATAHRFWYRNENLLLINPLTLSLAVLLPLALSRPRWMRAALVLSLLGALLAVVALLFKLFPGSQANMDVIMLMLPMHLGMLVAVAFVRAARADPSMAAASR